jgi:hypothetical protein
MRDNIPSLVASELSGLARIKMILAGFAPEDFCPA